MWLGFLFILNRLFGLFVHSFIFCLVIFNNADLRPNMPEVTTGSRGYKQARVKRKQADKFLSLCLLLFYSSCIILNYRFFYFIEFMYLYF